MAAVQLRLGDIFDGPCDMVVVPCSTEGAITRLVLEKLTHFRLPPPKPKMQLGEVSIAPFEGGENIAQYVAYAASVGDHGSNAVTIGRVGDELGQFTTTGPCVRLISAPLLGAGAGGLAPAVAVTTLGQGFRRSAHPDASLAIHVLREDVFETIRKSLRSLPVSASEETATDPAPRVFISYSHGSSDHVKWVESLATFLRENGVDARLDLWHLRRGMDLPQFMTNELTLADRVLIVSDEKYAQKADGRVGGVGWETMIVQGDLAQLPPESTKYLVVVRSAKVERALPHFLKTKFVIHWPDSDADRACRDVLLREIFYHIGAPKLGKRPIFL